MIEKTTINVGTSLILSETKKYPRYVGKKWLLANSISLTELLLKVSLGNFKATKKLRAVKIIGIKIKIVQE